MGVRKQTNAELDERADRFNRDIMGVTRAEAVAEPDDVVLICLEYNGGPLDMEGNRVAECPHCHRQIQYRPQNEMFRTKRCLTCYRDDLKNE